MVTLSVVGGDIRLVQDIEHQCQLRVNARLVAEPQASRLSPTADPSL